MSVDVYLPPVLQLISENIARHGNPLGLSGKECTAWADGLAIPPKGKTILYTGCEYQMTAHIQSLIGVLKKVKFGDTAFSAARSLGRISGKFGLSMVGTYGKVAGSESEKYNRILKMAALNLRHLGVDFAYLAGELYSGALLYEYGLFEEFSKQAKLVAQQFKEAGVTRIIALSPHSAEVFREVYPQFVPDFQFEVSPYVCVIADALKNSPRKLSLPKPLTLTIHDPCHLARSLNVTEEPREVLGSIANLEIKEVSCNKAATVCCGAPAETIFPELTELLAARRAKELADTGAEAAVTLCPFCHSNLARCARSGANALAIVDFIEIVYQALGVKDAGI